MKKTLFVCALVMAICTVNAQFGIQAGPSFYTLKEKNGDESANYKTKVGFTAGVVASIPISNSFSFMPSANFTLKGGKYSESGYTSTASLNYIELPLNFVYTHKGFFAGAGPDLAFGMSGKGKNDDGDETETYDIRFGNKSDEDDLKPLEFGINILAGYKLDNGLFFSVNFNPGINNIAAYDTDTYKVHNSGFNIRIGYLFGKTKKEKK
jgi:hypothetical protein